METTTMTPVELFYSFKNCDNQIMRIVRENAFPLEGRLQEEYVEIREQAKAFAQQLDPVVSQLDAKKQQTFFRIRKMYM